MRVEFAKSSKRAPADVIGVVATMRDSLFDQQRGHVYLPASRYDMFNAQVHVATHQLPDQALLTAIRDAAHAVDSALPLLTLTTFTSFVDQSVEVWTLRTGGRLFATFAVVALLLVMAGVYGVQAFRIAQRTREIGLRMALGANLRDTVRLVLVDGPRVAAVGTTVGVALAGIVATLLRAVLVDVSPLDPVVIGGAWTTHMLVAFGACLVPAQRAGRLDPLMALRDE